MKGVALALAAFVAAGYWFSFGHVIYLLGKVLIAFVLFVVALGCWLWFDQAEARHGVRGASVSPSIKITNFLLQRLIFPALKWRFPVGIYMSRSSVGGPLPVHKNVTFTDTHRLGDLPAFRIFRPTTPPPPGGFPVVVYAHGGGFVLGSAFFKDSGGFSQRVAACGYLVISVDYSLAPQHKFPAAFNDMDKTVLWLRQQSLLPVPAEPLVGADLSKITVMGDSAGAVLATAAAMLDRNRVHEGKQAKAYVTKQVLIYIGFFSWPCDPQFSNGYLLSDDLRDWFHKQFLSDPTNMADPLLDPSRSQYGLKGMPPAFIIAAEYDMLSKHSSKYAEQLREAGVAVAEKRYDVPHGFILLPWLPQALCATNDICNYLKTT
eukprot:TRINITY_DN712_c0_g1_i1.p1 TRINITY_DN712_c0_g1~~TRINITY_DN712_c0_g1_i1.p1  ORF type:complete len:392 (+),score=77.28 TRINITY_DN712_c0_g1_i1:51-1178(+)